MMIKNKKVIIAMSGGVDSSVSAWFLKQQNYHVEGLFMKNWEEDDTQKYCKSAQDLSDAKDVCKQLKIYLHKINFSKEYWEQVFELFLNGLKKGNTPNPDILCNKEIKFKVFFDYAINELQADYIATGHYARIMKKHGKYYLLKGIDTTKDQSYFLYTLKNSQLKNILFPVGMFKKTYIRRIAQKLGFKIANKKDSTGICFIETKKINYFLRRYIPTKIGDIVTTSGEIVGKHNGLFCYTLGQRKGLGIGGIRKYYNIPWYVVEKNVKTNTLVVAQGLCNKYLMSYGLIAENINWINNKKLVFPFLCNVKIRYRQNDIPCNIEYISDHHIKIMFHFPMIAVTPGQSVVFYLLDVCIGGAIIKSRIPLCKIRK